MVIISSHTHTHARTHLVDTDFWNWKQSIISCVFHDRRRTFQRRFSISATAETWPISEIASAHEMCILTFSIKSLKSRNRIFGSFPITCNAFELVCGRTMSRSTEFPRERESPYCCIRCAAIRALTTNWINPQWICALPCMTFSCVRITSSLLGPYLLELAVRITVAVLLPLHDGSHCTVGCVMNSQHTIWH